MKTYLIRSSVSLALVGITLLTPTFILAYNPWLEQVKNLLLRAVSVLKLGDYRLTQEPYIYAIKKRTYDDLTLNLDAGISYAFIAVCDEDCSDIDLRLYDQNGNLIDSDLDSSDVSAVTVIPRWPGQFTVRVTMASCSASHCYYGVGVFGR